MKKIASIIASFVVLLGGQAMASQNKLTQFSGTDQNDQSQNQADQNRNQQNSGQNAQSQSNQNFNQGQGSTNSGSTQNVEPNILNIGNNQQLGNYLIGSNGMTLYKTSNDKNNQSFCTGQCVNTWIPYTVSSGVSLNLGNQIRGKISTITRSDGINQVTYNGQPLYYFSGDTRQGDTNGQSNDGWQVAKP